MKPVTDARTLEQLGSQNSGVAVQDPAILANLNWGLDFSKTDNDVRAAIGKLPETEKHRAHDAWADYKVAKERAAGFKQGPFLAEGIPIVGGLLDEATAGIQAGLNAVTDGRVGEPYDEALALQRARSRQADAASPAQAFVGKGLVGLATGGPVFGRIAPAATAAGRIGQGVALGGSLGAVEGFTRGEGSVSDRIDAAKSGAKFGAGLGGLFPAVGSGATALAGSAAGRAVRNAGGRVGDSVASLAARFRHGPEEAADVILQRRIMREGSTPAQKRLDLQRGQAVDSRLHSNSNATLPETIADTSDAMQRLTGSVYRAGGEAGNDVRNFLETRQRGVPNSLSRDRPAGPQGQQERVLDATERALLIRSSESARRTDAQIMRDQAREGRNLYSQSKEQSEAFDIQPTLSGFVDRVRSEYPEPVANRLLRAARLFTRQSEQGSNRNVVDDITQFDASKKALDDLIEKAQRAGEGNMARELTALKNDLLARVHEGERNPIYAQARATWGSAAENREAIDLGRAALKENSEVSVEQYRELTDGQQRLFRLGFLESLRNRYGTNTPGNDATRIFQQTRVRDLMREIIPNSRSRNDVFGDRSGRFGELLRREQRISQTRNQVLGNSKTAQAQQDDMEFAGDALAGMWNRFRQSPSLFNMGIEAIGAGVQKIFGYRQDVAMALARRLLESDPTVRNQILRRLQARGGPTRWQAFADAIDGTSNTLIGAGAMSISDQRDEAR